MKTQIYSIYDAKALVFTYPFYAANNDVALRMVADAANDPNTYLNKSPGDYSMFRLGEFDDADGTVSSVLPEHVVLISQLIKKA